MDNQKKPTILLIASQMPQQELGMIAQLLQSQGFNRQPMDHSQQGAPSLVFQTSDGASRVVIRFYQDIGALRLELSGDVALKIGEALSQYMPPLTPELVGKYFDEAQSDMERRIYAILLVLTYPDATTAMGAIRKTYFDGGNDATREGVIQGLAFLETPDTGCVLEGIERDFKGEAIAALARKAIDALSERGLIRESEASFVSKVRAVMASNPKGALEQIEKYEAQGTAPGVRAMHAQALRLLGRNDEASALLSEIHVSDPDAADAFCERACLRETAGQMQAAFGDAQSALVIEPEHAEAAEIFNRLKMILSQATGSTEDKLQQLDEALLSSPNDANLLCRRAECLMALKRSAEAVSDLKTAQKASPNDPRLPSMLCEAYLAEGMYGSALEQATRAIKNHVPGDDVHAWLLKPRVFMAIGDIERAHEAIHEIPVQWREAPQVVFLSSILFEALGKDDLALSYYETHSQSLKALFAEVSPILYRDLPLLRKVSGMADLEVREAPAYALGNEPRDPLFKRCAHCGALTIKRRSQCKECGNEKFFD